MVHFSEGLAYVMNKEERGYIDTNGNFVFKLEKGIVGYGFKDGLSAVSNATTAQFGYIDKTGKLVIDYKFDEAGNFSEGLARVFFINPRTKQAAFGFINKKGDVVIDNVFEETSEFKEGRVFVAIYANDNDEELDWGILNADGIPVSEFEFAAYKNFSDSVAAVKKINDTL
jgi:hypothetical protein